ncbi:unnamed protein product [Rotaria sp. Silwood2]|nr:unnamed protein product [Rotaria sp. Silwood2]CAF3129010.1 unnamed protein product [Rotaria sp. Silwood2]CAF3549930.1 unnamed protein product [Rotaria sp. Silwood2]CAF4198459.1 unnamed protein product [Rotaria sp. Silwood2]CAF4448929.1 unnamed protein product [Rotaria sp. Silwood2]
MRMNKNINMSDNTQLESIPNEILIAIFDYLSLHDLYQAFKGLNQRINDILQSLNNRAIRLWSTDEKNEIDMNIFFASTIISLDIKDEYDIDLNQYPKMRSLTYTYATETQLQHFLQSTFCHKHLKYLNVTSDDLSLLVKYIFSHEFSSLNQCILRNIDSLPMCPWRLTPSSCSIAVCSDENFIPSILKSCPNLKRLSLFIFEYSDTSLSSFVYHSHLKYLTIEMTQPAWTAQAIQTLFSSIQTPELISFRIVSYQASLIPFDFIQLIDIFNERLPNLQRFECNILLSKGVETIDLKTIRELHSFLFNHLKFENQFNGMLRIYTIDLED